MCTAVQVPLECPSWIWCNKTHGVAKVPRLSSMAQCRVHTRAGSLSNASQKIPAWVDTCGLEEHVWSTLVLRMYVKAKLCMLLPSLTWNWYLLHACEALGAKPYGHEHEANKVAPEAASHLISHPRLEISGFCITRSIEWMDQELRWASRPAGTPCLRWCFFWICSFLGATWHPGVNIDLGGELLHSMVHGSRNTSWSCYLTKAETFSTMAQNFQLHHILAWLSN